ncbi:MAG TPA: PHP domain-containing protein [Actinomycetota bacterium]|nr:PHP domain-containing protein [Actinomycetota bacterium]
MSLSNADLSELLALASGQETGTKHKALRRAAGRALIWPEEAAEILATGRELTVLPGVGPYLARRIGDWLADPPEVPVPPPLRRGFLTMAIARSVVEAHPEWMPRADLQMHTDETDGSVSLKTMVEACRELGHELIAITDHSQALRITNGMDEARLARQGAAIRRINARGEAPLVLRGIEMNLTPEGEGDMEPSSLRSLDLVLGAFHSKLRVEGDQTQRYLKALRNPHIHVLAHPRGRVFNFRTGLDADWERVFAEAERQGKALEIDATVMRQDLDVELLMEAKRYDVRFTIGSDAHHPNELHYLTLGAAAAILAGIPRERILNFRGAAGWPVSQPVPA